MAKCHLANQPWVFFARDALSIRVLLCSKPGEGREDQCSEGLGKPARSHWACVLRAAYGAQQMVQHSLQVCFLGTFSTCNETRN